MSATPNNLCCSLIVYGSFIPGGEKHGVFADLPGRWQKGKILANKGDTPDQIGPGEEDVIEAWRIDFEDCPIEFYGDNYNERDWNDQERRLYERWTELDEAMGPEWARSEERWWAEGVEPVVSADQMFVINIYLPIEQFTYLNNQQDAVAPDDKWDQEKLWMEVKRGEKKYDWSEFAFFLSDTHPSRFETLFGDLPKGDKFIARLNKIYDAEDLDPEVAYTDHHYFASTRRSTNKTIEEAHEIVTRHLKQQETLLRFHSNHKDADLLQKMPILLGEGYVEVEEYCDCFAAWDLSINHLRDSKALEDWWLYCLKEACGGLTRHNYMSYWLLRDWYDLPIDLEPICELFLAGYWFQIVDGTCYVFSVRVKPDDA